MKSVKAIIRPEKVFEVMEKLSDAGFHAVTRMTILGRGKQRGLKVGNVYYDEIPKELIEIVVEDGEVDKLVSIIENNAKTMTDGKLGTHVTARSLSWMWNVPSPSVPEKKCCGRKELCHMKYLEIIIVRSATRRQRKPLQQDGSIRHHV